MLNSGQRKAEERTVHQRKYDVYHLTVFPKSGATDPILDEREIRIYHRFRNSGRPQMFASKGGDHTRM